MNQAARQQHDIFFAIADPTRRKMIQLLSKEKELALHELTPHFPIGRTAVTKHLTILNEVNLVYKRKVGRETIFSFNGAPLQEIKDWVLYYEEFWRERGNLLKNILEE
ncbi:ArsR/SmtB family transcription factor [Alkalihalobacillus trypoxylicola]|uniref:Transcriptional regulator n=1 Tax=Alkalihalobacillus trypoxylicola TaxID=519424 RepID=A0A162F762_9BACI|nr:metalloregulator ArsR/SmtB family transcription factor [Alkalihalobacillus trypoxylicola]KYG34949.1 transcriptional regulator [Alkalihalobacillus trypoxylicola]GAF63534.1 putative transcriptional regulator [Bacillus sp. TS-2]